MNDRVQTSRLLLILAVLLIVGFAATSLVSYYVSRQTLRAQIITNELPLTSDNIYSEIQRDLLPPVFIASLMANDSFLRNWVIDGEQNADTVTQFLRETQHKYHTFTSFFVSEKTRVYYQSKGILKKVEDGMAQDKWYFRVRSMLPDHEINVDPDQANQYSMAIFVNHKVYDFKGNYIGATGVGLQASAVKKIIESYQRRFNRTVYFVAKDGSIVLCSADLPSNAKNIKTMPGFASLADEILRSGSETSSREYNKNGTVMYVNSRYIPELNWILLVEQSDENVIRNIYHTLLLNMALCGLVTFVILLMIWMNIRSHRRRLTQMLTQEIELKNTNSEQQQQIGRQHDALVVQNEKLIQLNASKDKLFSIIAHDLRSPIGNISQLVQVIETNLSDGDRDNAMALLSKLNELSGSTSKLLDNLFDWAKSQMSEITCEPVEFRLGNLLQECLIEGEINARKKNIALSLVCDDDIVVSADANMTKTVFRNLLTNAIKFTPRNGTIKVNAINASSEYVMVSIHDSGVGIDPERLEHLFDFIQNKNTFGTEGEAGSGLGLSLCKELIRKNGGEIFVESKIGSGSVFSFTINAVPGK